MNKKSLKEKINNVYYGFGRSVEVIGADDVKEFIKELKEEFHKRLYSHPKDEKWVQELINKLSGFEDEELKQKLNKNHN
ncbi:MAG: hypothetical protein ACOC5T_08355 [Elusimicrobiota bacterium]